jgi:hypothetical protein
LHAAGPVERPLEIPAFDGVQRRLQVEPLVGDLKNAGPPSFGPRIAHRRGKRVNAEDLTGAEHDGPLEHVLELPDVTRPAIAFQHRHGLRSDPPDILS